MLKGLPKKAQKKKRGEGNLLPEQISCHTATFQSFHGRFGPIYFLLVQLLRILSVQLCAVFLLYNLYAAAQRIFSVNW